MGEAGPHRQWLRLNTVSADVDGDGSITIADVTAIIDSLLGN